MFTSNADAQTQSPERFEDIPRIELEAVEAGSYNEHLNNLKSQAALAIGLASSIQAGIENNTIVAQEHIDDLKDQLKIFKESIYNVQLMAITASALDGMQNSEVINDLGPIVVPTLSTINAAERLLEDLEGEEA